MTYLAVVATPSQQHIITKPDPRPYQPVTSKPQVQVPDGGAGWTFVLAAVITIGFAAIMRRWDGISASASRD